MKRQSGHLTLTLLLKTIYNTTIFNTQAFAQTLAQNSKRLRVVFTLKCILFEHTDNFVATMNDVAQAANVSTSTVSHVLNGTRHVHPDTVRAVHEAIAKVGYVPNALARALAGAGSRTIGIAVSALSNQYFHETLFAIERECALHGIMVLYADTHNEAGREFKAVQALHQRRVDGIVFLPSHNSAKSLAYLQQHRIPTVLVDRLASPAFDQVGAENLDATANLVTHLIEHGHRRIGFLLGQRGLSTTDERFAGYKLALQRADIAFDPSLVVEGDSDVEAARIATRQLLALNPRPSAIFSANNLMTIGAVHVLRDAGLEIPEHMVLAGFDDFEWADFFSPRLSLIAQPVEAIGVKAVQMLMERIKNPERSPQTLRLPPTLHLRHSCGCVER